MTQLARPASLVGSGPVYRDAPTSMATGAGTVRIAGVDGLRAFAVAVVIAFHFGLGLNGGFLGVDLFFVISGFVICRALVREREMTDRTSLSAFWRRRFRRIFPSLALVLVVVAIWTWAGSVSASFRHTASEGILAALVSAANWWQIFGSTGYWSLGSDRDPLAHLWSLGVEEQFYLVFPLLFIVLVRFVSASWRWRVAAIAAVAAYVWAGALAVISDAAANSAAVDRVYLGTDTRSGALLAGCAVALYFAHGGRNARHERRRDRRRSQRVTTLLTVACVLVLAVLWVASDVDSTMFFTVELPVAGLAAATLIGCVVHSPASGIARVLAGRPLVLIGRWSYSLYLWHWVVWVFLLQTPVQGTPFIVPIALAVTVALSAGTYYLVERPVLRRNWSWTTTAVVVGIVSAVLALSAISTLATVPLPDSGTGGVTVTTH